MRINKFLAESGFGSRRKCEELILQKRVKVNGKLVLTLAFNVAEKRDKVEVDGILVEQKDYKYLMFHKPKGVVTTKSDDKGRKTVMDFLPQELKYLNPVGRLDYDTEGLLLFTNDGEFANILTHPIHELAKTYHVRIEGDMKESELAVLRAGVVIDGRRTDKSKVKVISKDSQFTTVEMTIFEGRNRQIRKMMEAIGKHVDFLKRVAIGDVRLGGISRGKFRFLKPEEIELLMMYRVNFD